MTPHHTAVVTAYAALKATRLLVIDFVLNEAASTHAGVGVLAGGALAEMLARRTSEDKKDPTGSADAGAMLAAVFGAVIGGAIGHQIVREGKTLGRWTRDNKDRWTFTPAQRVAPLAKEA
jgi:hypothetical protein